MSRLCGRCKVPTDEIQTHHVPQYLLTSAETALPDFLVHSLLSGTQEVAALRRAVATTCASLVPHAIGLTDAFGFSDWELDR